MRNKSKLEDLIWHVGYYWNQTIYFFRNVYRGVLNLVQWSPTIYKDRDWDYSYIFLMLKFKLERVLKATEEYDLHSDSQRTVRHLKYALFLIDRITDDHPDDIWKGFEFRRGSVIDMINCDGTPESIAYNTKLMELCDKEYERREDAKKRLFRHLDRYIQRWWI